MERIFICSCKKSRLFRELLAWMGANGTVHGCHTLVGDAFRVGVASLSQERLRPALRPVRAGDLLEPRGGKVLLGIAQDLKDTLSLVLSEVLEAIDGLFGGENFMQPVVDCSLHHWGKVLEGG